MRFWDSSALVLLMVEEKNTAVVQGLYRGDPEMLVWTLSDLEVSSALCRRLREGKLSERDFAASNQRLLEARRSWHEVRNVQAVRTRARRLLRTHPLRAGDAVQLAAALVALREEAEGFEFLTYDSRLHQAAQAEGFTVPLGP